MPEVLVILSIYGLKNLKEEFSIVAKQRTNPVLQSSHF